MNPPVGGENPASVPLCTGQKLHPFPPAKGEFPLSSRLGSGASPRFIHKRGVQQVLDNCAGTEAEELRRCPGPGDVVARPVPVQHPRNSPHTVLPRQESPLHDEIQEIPRQQRGALGQLGPLPELGEAAAAPGERPEERHQPRGARGRWGNGEGGAPAQGIPGAPCPASAVLGHSRPCWAFPAQDAPVPGDPAPAPLAVTELLSLPPHARTATFVRFSFSLLLFFPPSHPAPAALGLSRARLVPRCRSLRDRPVPASFPGPEQRSLSEQPRAEPGGDPEAQTQRSGPAAPRVRGRGAEETVPSDPGRRHLTCGRGGAAIGWLGEGTADQPITGSIGVMDVRGRDLLRSGAGETICGRCRGRWEGNPAPGETIALRGAGPEQRLRAWASLGASEPRPGLGGEGPKIPSQCTPCHGKGHRPYTRVLPARSSPAGDTPSNGESQALPFHPGGDSREGIPPWLGSKLTG